jgi:hypothetical protein
MSNIEIDINTIDCPVCNNTYDIFDFFPHLYTQHPELLATWAGVVFPTLNPNNEEDLNHMFLNLNINQETLNQHMYNNTQEENTTQEDNTTQQYYNDIFDQMTYEQLTELCNNIGYHRVGVSNIDLCAPAKIQMKKTIHEEIHCPICLENIHTSLYMRQVKKCSHKFCGSCIEKWLKENKTCPVCKVNVEENLPEEETNNNSIIFNS